MDVMKDLRDWVGDLRYRETWITAPGLFALIAIAGTITTWVLSFFTIDPRLRLACILGVGAATAIGWWVARPIYWRWGFGRKVGISYDLYKMPMHEWAETRRQLARLCESFSPDQKIHLKLIPTRMTENAERMSAAQRRYRIPLMFRVTLSPLLKKPEDSQMKVLFRATFGAELANEFITATNAHAAALAQRGPVHSAKELLDHKAASLFELTLLYLGIIDFAQRRHTSAAKFLTKLDESIAPRFAKDQQPRIAFRWLTSLCLTNSTAFAGDSPPDPDDLLRNAAVCRQAVAAYGEFPHVHTQLARQLFYLGETAAAFDANEQAFGAKYSEPNILLSARLNRAVLHLFLDRPVEAATTFAEFLSSGRLDVFTWSDLIGFADYAQANGNSAAIYIRALYRKISGEALSADLMRKFQTWIAADARRNELGILFHTKTPTLRAPSRQSKRKNRPKRGKAKKRRR